MCDQDEVQRILQKTRAQRERLNRHLIEVGELGPGGQGGGRGSRLEIPQF